MKKYISSVIILSAIALIAFSFKTQSSKIGPGLQELLDKTNQDKFTVWIYLKDKGPDTEQLLSNPLKLVTQRSIDRRLKVKSPENVVDITDVPVYQPYVTEIASGVEKVRVQAKWLNSISAEVTRPQLDNLSLLDYVEKIEKVETYIPNKNCPEDLKADNSPIENPDNPLLDTLNYGSGNAVTQITQIKVNLVHNQGIFGQGIIIANLDAGFSNLTHEAFTTLPMKINATWDFYTGQPTLTGNSHGTSTLSLVGGYKPTKLIGPAFKSAFILARTEVTTWERPVEMDYWIAAASWVDSLGADVITSSLGYLDFDPPYTGYEWTDMNGNTMPITIAADLAVNKGIVVSNSAGNNYSSSHNTLNGPADGDSVLTVGSVTSSGIRSSFSSVGPTTDNPPRIKPDVMAMGSSNYTAGTQSPTSYSTGSGTSFSCPLTSGVCALVLSANKDLTPMQVVRILRKFASNSSSPNNLMGWGIIDASLAVDSARKLDNTPPVIQHTQPFTNTTVTGVITMKARITDNGIIRNWTNQAPLLYYRKSTNGGGTWTNYTPVTYSSISADTFFFPITGSTAGTRVEYYFAAQDIALPAPKMSTLPSGGSGINPPGTTAPPARFTYNVNLVGISGNTNEIPEVFKLYNNYPNPFNPVTKIKFDIPANVKSEKSNVKMIVYDILGREVSVLVNEQLNPGSYEVDFDASNFTSGVYFYRLETDGFTDTKKMLLVK
jgi:serine protease AprX